MDDTSAFRPVGKRAVEAVPVKHRRQPGAHGIPVISCLLLAIIVLGCVFAPVLANHDPTMFYLDHLNKAPDSAFYFGTDSLGRDIYSIIWYGGRISLTVGVLSMAIATAIGLLYGCISGMGTDTMDNVMMRTAELISSIPSILLMLLLLAILDSPSVVTLSIVIGVTQWMNLARMTRTEIRQIRSSDYILAARAMGATFPHILRHHLLPNVLSPLLFMIISLIGTAMTTEATLSFLGIGLPVEIVSWGTMLSLSSRALLTNSWWIICIPGFFLVATLTAITRVGHALRHHAVRSASNL